YMKGWPASVSIWKASSDGTQEVKILDSVDSYGEWTVGREGIYFFTTPNKTGFRDICLYGLATGETGKIITGNRPVEKHISIYPDGRTIIYPQSDESGSVLMFVENFH